MLCVSVYFFMCVSLSMYVSPSLYMGLYFSGALPLLLAVTARKFLAIKGFSQVTPLGNGVKNRAK